MNHSKATLAIAAIATAVALTGVVFAMPQQALAHYGHHNHHGNSIKVHQQIASLNDCITALCENNATNTADIQR